MSKPRVAGSDYGGDASRLAAGTASFRPLRGLEEAPVEVKFIDHAGNQALANGPCLSLVDVPVGSGLSERIGSSIRLKELLLSFTPEWIGPNAEYAHWRVTVFTWHPSAVGGAGPVPSDIFELHEGHQPLTESFPFLTTTNPANQFVAPSLASFNDRNKKQFTVLTDLTGTLTHPLAHPHKVGAGVGAINKLAIPLNTTIYFDDERTPVYAKHQVFLMFTASSTEQKINPFVPTLSYAARVTYCDVN